MRAKKQRDPILKESDRKDDVPPYRHMVWRRLEGKSACHDTINPRSPIAAPFLTMILWSTRSHTLLRSANTATSDALHLSRLYMKWKNLTK